VGKGGATGLCQSIYEAAPACGRRCGASCTFGQRWTSGADHQTPRPALPSMLSTQQCDEYMV
jgi:hypothetical protein